MRYNLIYFGSFLEYSAHVLEVLLPHYSVTAVVTTPPKPKGRHLIPTPTAVARVARNHKIPVFELDSLDSIPNLPVTPDFLVVAGFGKIIPAAWLALPKIMPVNMHPSLLPHLRGAFPGEWAILRGDEKTGVSLVKMSEEFDKGDILARREIAIAPSHTRETLYRTLYELGAELLVETLPKIAEGTVTPQPQPKGDHFYARRLTRQDGYIPWELVEATMSGKPHTAMQQFNNPPIGEEGITIAKVMNELHDAGSVKIPFGIVLDRAVRAFSGWPGVWTEIEIRIKKKGKRKTRLKILRAHTEASKLIIDTVQLEGTKAIPYVQFITTNVID